MLFNPAPCDKKVIQNTRPSFRYPVHTILNPGHYDQGMVQSVLCSIKLLVPQNPAELITPALLEWVQGFRQYNALSVYNEVILYV